MSKEVPLRPGQIKFVEGNSKDWPIPILDASPTPPLTILDEAKAVVLGSRAADYGRCYPLYQKLASVMNAIFADRFHDGGQFAAADMPIILILLKLCREQHKPKRDNRVDIAGYAQVLDAIQQDLDRMFGKEKVDVVPDKR